MISYNPKNWSGIIFDFHKSDTFRALLPLLAAVGVYSGFVAFFELRYYHLTENPHVRNLNMLHNLLGFAISMLLVFRTNTAYDRWWEGRRMWGSLVNCSRNLAIKISSMITDEEERLFFKQIIPRFALELKNHLQLDETRFALDEKPHPEIPEFDRNKHVPNQVVGIIMQRVTTLYQQKVITGDQLIIINGEITTLLDVCGACERIKNTPIPYSYSSFIKKFLSLYILTLPFGLVFSLGYLVIPVVVFIFYVQASLELIAEEIEDPFGKDSNDLPMQRISDNIQRNVIEIFT